MNKPFFVKGILAVVAQRNNAVATDDRQNICLHDWIFMSYNHASSESYCLQELVAKPLLVAWIHKHIHYTIEAVEGDEVSFAPIPAIRHYLITDVAELHSPLLSISPQPCEVAVILRFIQPGLLGKQEQKTAICGNGSPIYPSPFSHKLIPALLQSSAKLYRYLYGLTWNNYGNHNKHTIVCPEARSFSQMRHFSRLALEVE